jgi:hypothetical protein
MPFKFLDCNKIKELVIYYRIYYIILYYNVPELLAVFKL